MNYFVYILISIRYPEKIYIGVTNDVRKRLSQHNEGKSKYTAYYKPWRVACVIGFIHRFQAEDFERYLKNGSGFAFLKKRLLP